MRRFRHQLSESIHEGLGWSVAVGAMDGVDGVGDEHPLMAVCAAKGKGKESGRREQGIKKEIRGRRTSGSLRTEARARDRGTCTLRG